jgi:hypothetical protein
MPEQRNVMAIGPYRLPRLGRCASALPAAALAALLVVFEARVFPALLAALAPVTFAFLDGASALAAADLVALLDDCDARTFAAAVAAFAPVRADLAMCTLHSIGVARVPRWCDSEGRGFLGFAGHPDVTGTSWFRQVAIGPPLRRWARA